MLNYYELLKFPEAITQEEIELAFNNFKSELLKFSPGIQLNESELKLRQPEIWNAYAVLLNPEMRKEHDELLERDRVHKLYEAKIKMEEEQQIRSSAKWKYIGLGATLVIIVVYFLLGQVSSNNLPEKPNWRTHYINNEVAILLPAKTDTLVNILPPYLANYINKSFSYNSELSNGFCVTIAIIHMNEGFKVSLKDLKYITSMESQNPHLRMKSNIGEEINGSYKGYKMTIAKESYQIDNVIRASENYTFLKDLIAIKLIVNYNPGDPLQEKYNEIVFKSIN
jgi:hypothetical protein